MHAANKLFFGDENMFGLDGEGNIANWFSSVLFALAGANALAVAVLDRGSRWPWAIVGLILIAFSFDDAVSVHEATERETESLSRLVLQPLVVAVMAVSLVVIGRRQPRTERLLLTFATSAVVLALATSMLNRYADLNYAPMVAVHMIEETCEMLLPAFVLAAAVAAANRLLDVRVVGQSQASRQS